MKCPKCGTVARFKDYEKDIAQRDGVVLHSCGGCRMVYQVSYADTLNAKARMKELRETGRCIYCGDEADAGYVSCKACRDEKAKELIWTRSIAHEAEEKAQAREDKKKAKPSIEDITKMAREKGVSYGTMVAIMDARKSR